MKTNFKKIIAVLVLICFISNGWFGPQKASAVTLGELGKTAGLFGGGIVVYNLAPEVVCGAYSGIKTGLKKAVWDNIGKPIVDKAVEESRIKRAARWLWGKGKELVKKEVQTQVGVSFGDDKVPVRAKDLESEVQKNRETAVQLDCENFVKKVVLTNFKKRFLDLMADQIVTWIQGGGEPQFVTNTGQFLRDAGDAAAGDVIQEIGMGKFCKAFGGAGLKLQLNLQSPPKFSERISCTLSDVVDNLDDFRKNFSAGGFIGYQTLMEPNNNKFGLSLLAFDEFLTKTAENEEIAKQEAMLGAGFLANKICHEWTEILEPGENRKPEKRTGEEKITITDKEVSLETYSPEGKKYTGKFEQPLGSKFRCTKSEVITPGKIAGEAVAETIKAHFAFINNADDLGAYAAAISDALINRVIMETDKGLFHTKLTQRSTEDNLTALGTHITETRGNRTSEVEQNFAELFDSVQTYTEKAGITKIVSQTLSKLEPELQEAKETAEDTIAILKETKQVNEKLYLKPGENVLGEFLSCGQERLNLCIPEQKEKLDDAQKTTVEEIGLCEPNFTTDIEYEIKTAEARSLTFAERANDSKYKEFNESASLLISIPDEIAAITKLKEDDIEKEQGAIKNSITKAEKNTQSAQDLIKKIQDFTAQAKALQNKAYSIKTGVENEYEQIKDLNLIEKCKALPVPELIEE